MEAESTDRTDGYNDHLRNPNKENNMLRKIFLSISFLIILTLVVPAQAAQTPQIPLPPNPLTWQFVQPLPLLSAAGGTIQTVAGSQPLRIHMCEFRANILPPGALAGYTGTWVWGYLAENASAVSQDCAGLVDFYSGGSGVLDTYTGPVILNQRNQATEVTWINDLPTTATTNVLAYKYSTDQTLHWADPLNGEMNMCNHMAMYPAWDVANNKPDACAENYDGPIPAVVHLHGGEVPPELDGGPDAWYTSNGQYQGHAYYTKNPGVDAANSAVYSYPNTQEATPAWVHDHTLGATRLNVYAGLAGGYLISDPAQILPAGLSAYGLSRGGSVGASELTVPLVIQDRRFDTNGQLFFPADSAGGLLWSPNPEHPYWVPEFSGDTLLVNGKTWPYLNVEPKRYRFLFLNGSNARTYEMNIVDPAGGPAPNFYVIGTDGGYLDTPVMLKKLTMMPGERYEVILDFSVANPGANLVIKNTAKTPFPAGVAPKGATLGQVLQFRLGSCTSGQCGFADTSFNPAAAGALIRQTGQKIVRLPGTVGGPAIVISPANSATQNVQKIRQLTLNEVMGMPMAVTDPVTGLPAAYPGGPLEILVNNTKWGGERITGVSNGHYTFEPIPGFTGVTLNGQTTYYSEMPREGDTEIWEFVNTTADAHPMHLHLVQFQLIERQAFDAGKYAKDYAASFPGGGWDPMLGAACAPGVYCPSYGPPLAYDPAGNPKSGGKWGGNPDVYAVDPKTKKPLYLSGKAIPADPNERGWKDTVIAYPGQVTRIAVRWAPTDLAVQTTNKLGSLYYPFDPNGGASGHGYVWHCHIIDHEDNEMMRPDLVMLNPLGPAANARPFVKGIQY
jgi:spore coat protein A, manganese oxidase